MIIYCRECSRQIRSWHRRVRLDKTQYHLQCWDRRLFFKSLIRQMSEQSSKIPRIGYTPSNHAGDLRTLRESAQALSAKAEELEAKLQYAVRSVLWEI
jgi:hypothetical protein